MPMQFEDERQVLMDLATENGGVLTVDAVLDEARRPSSPLHRHFEWNDAAAAEQHRRWQARTLIARCHITVEHRPDTVVRAFVSLPSDRHHGGGYRLMAEVMTSGDQRAELMDDIRRRVSHWLTQAADLDLPVRQALRSLDDALAARLARPKPKRRPTPKTTGKPKPLTPTPPH